MAWSPTNNVSPLQERLAVLPWQDSQGALPWANVFRQLSSTVPSAVDIGCAILIGSTVSVLSRFYAVLAVPSLGLGCAGGLAYLAFHSTFGLERAIAAICAILFTLHSQSIQLMTDSRMSQQWAIIVLPLLLWATPQAWSSRSLLFTYVCAFLTGCSGYFVGIAAVFLATSGLFRSKAMMHLQSESKTLRHAAFGFIVLLAGYASARIVRQSMVSMEVAIGGSPLDWFDRQGFLRARVGLLPADFFTAGPSGYLGWSCLGLAIVLSIGIPWLKTSSHKEISWSFTAFAAISWLSLGLTSPHRFLVETIEYTTVRQLVDPTTLTILGIVLLFLALLVVTALAHCYRMLSTRRWRLPALILATGTTMTAWSLAPNDILSFAFTNRWLGEPTALSLSAVFCLVCYLGLGIQVLNGSLRKINQRAGVLLVVCALLLTDFRPKKPGIETPNKGVRPSRLTDVSWFGHRTCGATPFFPHPDIIVAKTVGHAMSRSDHGRAKSGSVSNLRTLLAHVGACSKYSVNQFERGAPLRL